MKKRKASNGAGTRTPEGGDNPGEAEKDQLARGAAELVREMRNFEALTERVGRVELNSEERLAKAGTLLEEAAASHLRFVEGLRALIGGIEDARQRQNQSAAALAEVTAKLDARRLEYTALVQRFQALGTTAQEIGELMRPVSSPEDPVEMAELRANMARVGERLGRTADELQSLVRDARAAHLVDLEQQADALFQRMRALARKFGSAG
jgi:hypothetical protein